MSDSKNSSAPTAAVCISFDATSRHWVATCDESSVAVSAPAYSQARRRIKRAVERARGCKVRIVERLTLPPLLERKLRRYQRRHAASLALTTFVRNTRLPLARELIALQISQADVAGLVGMTPAGLGALLEREARQPLALAPSYAAE